MNRLEKLLVFLPVLAVCLASCAPESGVVYKPAAQILPSHIKKIAVRPILNKTQQLGLEDKLNLKVIDEFFRDGRYKIVPEAQADGVMVAEISQYILQPVSYDSSLVPTSYQLIVLMNIKFLDRSANTYLWEEKNLEARQTYAAPTLPGGMTEEQAREAVWVKLAKDITTRTVEGFGSVTGSSGRKIQGLLSPATGLLPAATGY